MPLGDVTVHEYAGALPGAILVGVPTFGEVSIQWHVAMLGLRAPLNTMMHWYHVVGREVGDARNEIVQLALAHRGARGEPASHLFFIDDDTLPPPDALVTLLSRKLPIVSGLYFAKTQAPQPLILPEPYGGTLASWDAGALVSCYAHGMGCTLIQLDVFRALYEAGHVTTLPKTDRDHCRACGGTGQKDYDPCPGCFGTGCVVQWFKTTREFRPGERGQNVLFYETEDVHFLERAAACGFQPTVDTSVFCWHWNKADRRPYPIGDWTQMIRKGAA